MSATILFRIASVVFLLFAVGHTFGFLSFKPPTAEGLAVQKAMSNVVFKVGGSDLSYGGFYRGFGLSCTVSMLFSAILCWQLGALATTHPREITVIAWPLFVVQAIGVALSIKYFGWPPVICLLPWRYYWVGLRFCSPMRCRYCGRIGMVFPDAPSSINDGGSRWGRGH